jgi:predicted nucleotidyltransferase
MLERLFISKVRIKILKQFLLNPGKEYHIRALVRILSEEINAVRRELKNLEAFGLLKSKRQTNKIVYHVEENNPFLYELKSIVAKDSDDMKLIAKVLSSLENIDIVLITEAYLTKNYIDDSDVDILIVGSPNISKLNKEMGTVEKEIKRELRMAVLTKEDLEFRKKRREKFILDIIEREKIVLLGSPHKIGL